MQLWKFGLAAVVLAAGALGLAYWLNPVGLLDAVDRTVGGGGGTRLVAGPVPTGTRPGQRLWVFAPDPAPRGPAPVLVFFHGGSWNSGTPGDYRFIARTFARRGYVVVLGGYRLVPEGRFPLMLEDSAAVVRWVHDHIAASGGDPARVFLIGHSAGAYNVAMLGLERQWLGREGLDDRAIKGVIGLSGPYDFYPFTSDSARAAFGQAPDPAQTQPITFARGDAPPMLLVTGDKDTTVKPRNSFALAKALTADGAPTTPVVITGANHTDTVVKLAAPFSRDPRVLDAVLQFLSQHGAASAPVQGAGG